LTTVGRLMAYQRPFRASVASVGLVATAPASVSFLFATLVVSALWHDPPGAHLAVAACCAWRVTDLPRGPLLPLLGSAFLVQRPVEAAWTVAATWLVLGPLETVVGSRRLIALGALGHAVPTVLVDLCWLAGGLAGQGLGGLDVGTSAVVVTAAAALAVATRSLPVAAVLATGLAVDVAAAPDLATAEHLVAVAIGVGFAMAFLRHRQGVGAPPPQEPATSLQRWDRGSGRERPDGLARPAAVARPRRGSGDPRTREGVHRGRPGPHGCRAAGPGRRGPVR